MSVLSTSVLPSLQSQLMSFFRRFSVDEYHRMIETKVLTDEDRVELLDGFVVLKMLRNPPHDNTILKLSKRLSRMIPEGWELRNQSAVTLLQSEPEPDLAIVRGDESTFASRHPAPAEVGLLIEVADSTLHRDQTDKLHIYASAGIACYWIVNLVDRRIEVYTSPTSASTPPRYGQHDDYGRGDAVPLVLDRVQVGGIAVSEIVD